MNISNKDFLKNLKNTIENESLEDQVKSNINEKPNTFDKKVTSTREIMSGNKIKTPRFMVNTDDCVMWERHNRNYELLNEIRCADLISGFKEMGKQEFPAIVRSIQVEDRNRYEIICGARRFWTANYLGWKLFVEVRNLSDEEAFRLSDIENRDREDISDYERALDYKTALSNYYTNQAQMADRLEVGRDWLSRFLYLADLPKEIIRAYKDVTEIKLHHARLLKPYLSGTGKNRDTKDKIIEKANELHGSDLPGDQIIHELLSVTKRKSTRGLYANKYLSEDGNIILSIKKNKDKKIQLTVELKSAEKNSKEDLITLINKNIDTYL